MSRRSYFVTGTDTGVGKTFVTAALARRGVELGKQVFAFKPIETGVAAGRGLGEDQEILWEAAGSWQKGALRGVYQFALAAAPAVAAAAEGRTIDLRTIDLPMSNGTSKADVVLVEGAGGWRVPISESLDMAGLARRLHLPVLVVARGGLGTINHTLLTVEAVQREGCSIAAVIISERPDDGPLVRSNCEQIQLRVKCRVVRYPADSLDFLL